MFKPLDYYRSSSSIETATRPTSNSDKLLGLRVLLREHNAKLCAHVTTAVRILTLLIALCAMKTGAASAQQGEAAAPAGASDGIIPALSGLWFVPERLKLRFPDAPSFSEEPVIYDRRFPLYAQEAIDRGFALPEPFGLSFIVVNNVQGQLITDLEVALGRGEPPPLGTELVPIPFVSLDDTVSDTNSLQLKADLWLLPNLNVFGTLGRVDGEVDLVVVVDPNDVLPPSQCNPVSPCEPLRAAFTAGVDTYSVTLGATAVYGWRNWFTSGTLSGTASFGENTDTTIRSMSGSARLGRRWSFGAGNLAAPYIGVSYFDLDQVVEGTTRLPDAFPNGDSLDVRYKARTRNVDKWAGILGINLGLQSGVGFTGEVSFSENSERIVLSANRRF